MKNIILNNSYIGNYQCLQLYLTLIQAKMRQLRQEDGTTFAFTYSITRYRLLLFGIERANKLTPRDKSINFLYPFTFSKGMQEIENENKTMKKKKDGFKNLTINMINNIISYLCVDYKESVNSICDKMQEPKNESKGHYGLNKHQISYFQKFYFTNFEDNFHTQQYLLILTPTLEQRKKDRMNKHDSKYLIIPVKLLLVKSIKKKVKFIDFQTIKFEQVKDITQLFSAFIIETCGIYNLLNHIVSSGIITLGDIFKNEKTSSMISELKKYNRNSFSVAKLHAIPYSVYVNHRNSGDYERPLPYVRFIKALSKKYSNEVRNLLNQKQEIEKIPSLNHCIVKHNPNLTDLHVETFQKMKNYYLNNPNTKEYASQLAIIYTNIYIDELNKNKKNFNITTTVAAITLACKTAELKINELRKLKNNQ